MARYRKPYQPYRAGMALHSDSLGSSRESDMYFEEPVFWDEEMPIKELPLSEGDSALSEGVSFRKPFPFFTSPEEQIFGRDIPAGMQGEEVK